MDKGGEMTSGEMEAWLKAQDPRIKWARVVWLDSFTEERPSLEASIHSTKYDQMYGIKAVIRSKDAYLAPESWPTALRLIQSLLDEGERQRESAGEP